MAGRERTCERRAVIDAMAATAHGGTADIDPIEDCDFMHTRDLAAANFHALGAM